MTLWASKFGVTAGALSGVIAFHREDSQIMQMGAPIEWSQDRRVQPPTEHYYVRCLFACDPMCPVCTQPIIPAPSEISEQEKAELGYGETPSLPLRCLEIGEIWLREYDTHASGLIISASPLPPPSTLNVEGLVEDLSVASGITSYKAPLTKFITEGSRENKHKVFPFPSSEEIAALQFALQDLAKHPSEHDVFSRKEITQHRLMAAGQEASLRERHIEAARRYQLLLFGPLLKRLFTDPMLKANHVWQGGDQQFVTPLAEWDAVFRSIVTLPKDADQTAKPSIPPDKPGRPPKKNFAELCDAEEALQYKEKHPNASWSETIRHLKWPLNRKAEYQRITRAIKRLQTLDEETRQAFEEYKLERRIKP